MQLSAIVAVAIISAMGAFLTTGIHILRRDKCWIWRIFGEPVATKAVLEARLEELRGGQTPPSEAVAGNMRPKRYVGVTEPSAIRATGVSRVPLTSPAVSAIGHTYKSSSSSSPTALTQ